MKKVIISAILAALLVLSLGSAALASGEEFAAPIAVEEDVSWQEAAVAPEDPVAPEVIADEAADESTADTAPAPDADNTTQDGSDTDTTTPAPEQTAPPEDRPDGWHYIDGYWYYYMGGYKLVSSWAMDGNDRCYVDEDGHMVAGFQEIDGQTYYFSEKHNGTYGYMLTGWQSIGGVWYYFESTGEMVASGWRYDGSSLCYLGEDGHMAVGFTVIGENTYYFNEKHNGAYGAMKTGWQSVGGDYYYFDRDGSMVTSDWRYDGSGRGYLGEDGRMLVGWHTVDGTRYYFQEKHNGSYGLAATKQTYIDGEMYMFNSDGTLAANTTVSLLGKTWNVDENGIIQGYVTPAGRKAAAVLDQVGWNLRSAFNWVVRLTYYWRWMRAPAGEVHTEYYANYGFDNHKGNCFVMNSTLYQMIKMMGYEVYFVEGGVLNSNGYLAPHGWTEVILDGVLYVYDANFTNETGMNGFHIRYGQPGTWRYASYKRVD